MKIQVKVPGHEYTIKAEAGILDSIGKEITYLSPTSIVLITDKTVDGYYGKRARASLEKVGCPVFTIVLPPGEKTKCIEQLNRLWDFFIRKGLDRSSLIVALGGGVIGDISGFAAASYQRGIRFVQVPTTLLAQVDSSVGGKTGINSPRGKNMIGAFHQPSKVLIDPKVLKTLDSSQYNAGVGEVSKYAMIWGTSFMCFLEKNIQGIKQRKLPIVEEMIMRSCKIKAAVVSQDEKESGLRAILNYGHTIAHAFESISNYKGYLHGEAVSAGMVYVCALAVEKGLCSKKVYDRQYALLENLGMRCDFDEEMTTKVTSKIIALMSKDKKALGGTTRFILPVKQGKVELFDTVTRKELLQVLRNRGRLI